VRRLGAEFLALLYVFSKYGTKCEVSREKSVRNAIEAGFERSMGVGMDERVRKFAIISAVIGFFAHLSIWVLDSSGRITITGDSSDLIKSPLSALYTPFSILLAYEVYQLIRTIPDSFSSSVGKQYEIATLLVVRDILKRLPEVDGANGWEVSDDLGFLLVECAAFLALFYTALTYYNLKKNEDNGQRISEDVNAFIMMKKAIAVLMLAVFGIIALSSLTGWLTAVGDGGGAVDRTIFFLDFFTFLILADILILLISYWYYTDFRNLARNTGFVLSTVIIRVAISAAGVSSMILFTLSGVLGIAILRMFANNKPSGASPQ